MSKDNLIKTDKLSEHSAAATLPFSVPAYNSCQLCSLLLPIHNYHILCNDRKENVSYYLLGLFVNPCYHTGLIYTYGAK